MESLASIRFVANCWLNAYQGYTNGWVASISFARGVPGGGKSLASAIARAANKKAARKKLWLSVASFLSIHTCCDLAHLLEKWLCFKLILV